MAKVLVVEDDDNVRALICEWVEDLGHQVLPAENGLVALGIAEKNRDLALILTDMVMPEMDGQEMIKRIRTMEGMADIPVLIISGIVGPKEIREVLERGTTEFQTKPLEGDRIREFIDRYIAWRDRHTQ
jgi:CheY-like chemotaxis protein